jgi:tetratricopeptide (TPR) repeat protein
MLARVVIAVFVLAAGTVRADEWVTPTKRTHTSRNKRMEVVIVPADDGSSGAKATISELGRPGATFTLKSPWMPVDSVLLDDGSLLTFDEWHSLGVGNVATLYERTGQVRWTRTLVDLIGAKLADEASHSVSSIWWRKTPLEWTLAADGKSGTVTLFDENQVQIALQDGAAHVVAVANLADDPQRLLNRAKALVSANQHGAALPLLERAIAKNADFVQALVVYVGALQATNDHARVAAVLDRESRRWTRPFKNPYDVANVCVAWATSLVALARPADAERTLRLAMQAAPTYVNPPVALAKLLLDQKRGKDADAVLDAYVALLAKQPNLDTYDIMTVGDFYKARNEPTKALAHYLRAYKPGEVTNQFLYTTLAELYEKLGNDAEAIRIDELLVAHYAKLGSSFDADAVRTRDELARLRRKPKR